MLGDAVVVVLAYRDIERAKAAREGMLAVARQHDALVWPPPPGTPPALLRRNGAAYRAIEAEVRRR